jgi:excisionase family DNA binding protein
MRRSTDKKTTEGGRKMDARMRPRWLKVGEAAELLNVSESTIRRCLADGELEGIKVRGAVRADRDSIGRMARKRRYADVARGEKGSARRWLPRLSRLRCKAS